MSEFCVRRELKIRTNNFRFIRYGRRPIMSSFRLKKPLLSLTNGLALSMWGVIIHSLLFYFTSQPHIMAPLQLYLSFSELIFTFLTVHFFSFYTYLLMDFLCFSGLVPYILLSFSPFLIWMKFPSFLIMALLCWMVAVKVWNIWPLF